MIFVFMFGISQSDSEHALIVNHQFGRREDAFCEENKIRQEMPNAVSLGDVDLAASCRKATSASCEEIFLPGTSSGFDP